MSFKKICMFIIISSIAFSGETFARYENDDAKSRVSAKRRPIRASQTTRKSLPQKAAPSSHLRKNLAARKRTAVPTNTRRVPSMTARKKAAAPINTRRVPLTTAQKKTAVPANKRRTSLTTQKKPAIPPKPRVKTPLPIEKKHVPAKAPVAKKTDEWIFQDERVKRSFAALKKSISGLEEEINALHESVNQFGKSTEELRRAGDALEESNKKMSDLLNSPGFEQKLRQKLKERFDKLDEAKKEELRRLIQGFEKAPSYK